MRNDTCSRVFASQLIVHNDRVFFPKIDRLFPPEKVYGMVPDQVIEHIAAVSDNCCSFASEGKIQEPQCSVLEGIYNSVMWWDVRNTGLKSLNSKSNNCKVTLLYLLLLH